MPFSYIDKELIVNGKVDLVIKNLKDDVIKKAEVDISKQSSEGLLVDKIKEMGRLRMQW